MSLALKLRTAAPFFEKKRKSHERLNCQYLASYVVQKARAEIADQMTTAERASKLSIVRLNNLREALSATASDPRTVNLQLRISKSLWELYGLDAVRQIPRVRPDREPTDTEETPLDFSKLTLQELLQYEALMKKAGGTQPERPGVIDFTPRRPGTGATKDQERRAS